MKTVAVVEDNADNRLLARTILEDLYEVVTYETGREALDGICAAPPDLVLLDISLPEMDGTEVLAALRAQPGLESLPIIALTAHAMPEDRGRYLDLGFDDYIAKPITDEIKLLEAIAAYLQD